MNREIGSDVYTLLCIKSITNENLLYSAGNSTLLSADLNGKEIQKRGNICTRSADSLCCPTETNTPS